MILANPAYLIMVVVQKPKQVALKGKYRRIAPLVSFWLYREREDEVEEELQIILTIVGQKYRAFDECSNEFLSKTFLVLIMIIGDRRQNLRLLAIGSAIISAGTLIAIYGGGSVALASHSFEAGVQGGNIPDNTHIRLDEL